GVPHIVAADVARAVREPVLEPAAVGGEQQARTLDRVAGNRDSSRLLALHGPGRIGEDYGIHLAVSVMLDADGLRLRPHLELAGRLAPRNLRIERRPFRAGLAAL